MWRRRRFGPTAGWAGAGEADEHRLPRPVRPVGLRAPPHHGIRRLLLPAPPHRRRVAGGAAASLQRGSPGLWERRHAAVRGRPAVRARVPRPQRPENRARRLLPRGGPRTEPAVRRRRVPHARRRHPGSGRDPPALVPRLMATREAERTPGTDARARPAVRTRPSFETWSWFFMRVSGLA